MRFLIVFAFALVLAVSAVASVGFVHEESYTISAFTPTLSTTQIVRLDESGTIGFLWHSDSEVRLYDPALDSVIFSHVSDTSETVLSTLVGDFSGDSTFEIVIVTVISTWSFEPTEWRVTCFNRAYPLPESTFVTYTSNTLSFYYFNGLVSILAQSDLNYDGRLDLLFSYNYVSGDSWSENLGGYSIAFDRFPDSLLWSRSYLTTALFSLEDANSTKRNLCRTYSDWYMDFGPDTRATESPIRFLRDDGTSAWISPACVDSGCDGGGGFNGCGYSSITTGDISSAFSGEEILATRSSSFYCPYDGGSNSTAELMLFSLDATTPTNVLNVIWSVPYTSLSPGIGNFMIHPNLPGYFFGIAVDTLFMFRGENGTIRYQTTDIPHGQRFWETRWPDSIPRLVVMNGNQVDIYSLDIATAVEDEPPSSLPQQFILGQPYPNPFNAEASIPIELPTRGHLRAQIFNLLGQTVATLADGDFSVGKINLSWDAASYPSGVYLIRADFGEKTETRKLVLLK